MLSSVNLEKLSLRAAQFRAENLFQATDDLIPDRRRVLIRQRLFIGLVREAERKAFLVRSNRLRPENIEQLDLLQDLSARLPDQRDHLRGRQRLIDDHRNILKNHRERRNRTDRIIHVRQRLQRFQRQVHHRNRVPRQVIVLLRRRMQLANHADWRIVYPDLSCLAGMEIRKDGRDERIISGMPFAPLKCLAKA